MPARLERSASPVAAAALGLEAGNKEAPDRPEREKVKSTLTGGSAEGEGLTPGALDCVAVGVERAEGERERVGRMEREGEKVDLMVKVWERVWVKDRREEGEVEGVLTSLPQLALEEGEAVSPREAVGRAEKLEEGLGLGESEGECVELGVALVEGEVLPVRVRGPVRVGLAERVGRVDPLGVEEVEGQWEAEGVMDTLGEREGEPDTLDVLLDSGVVVRVRVLRGEKEALLETQGVGVVEAQWLTVPLAEKESLALLHPLALLLPVAGRADGEGVQRVLGEEESVAEVQGLAEAEKDMLSVVVRVRVEAGLAVPVRVVVRVAVGVGEVEGEGEKEGEGEGLAQGLALLLAAALAL